MNRIVFLDIDGVLNNLGSALGLGNTSKHLDAVSVALVDRLCERTGARIVVSSSWRIGRPVEHLKKDLVEIGAGCLAKRIQDATPVLRDDRQDHNGRQVGRGREIKAWMRQRDFRGRYVILDDDSDFLPEQRRYFVQTRFADGFRVRHYVAALIILDPKHEDCRLWESCH